MEETSETYSEKMREYLRGINKEERQLKRDCIINRRRGILGDVSLCLAQNITPEVVITINNKMKRKNKATDEDIHLLTCAFIQNEENIITFINSDGNSGLHAMVRELSGVSSLTQLAVAECYINMSLGNSKCCFKIAKSSGTYLITHLQGMNLNLKVACIWALGNLVGSDIKTWKLLSSQGLLPIFLELLKVSELQENVIYALINYVKIGFREISPSDFVVIATSVVELKKFTPDVMWLLYLLSCSSFCDNIISSVILFCIDVLIKINNYCIKMITSAFRILGNIISEESGLCAEIVINNFDKINIICDNLIKSKNCYPHLINELIWLLGNLINHPSCIIKQKIQSNNLNFEQLKLILNSAVR